ncbi:MAG: 16S rRNA (cytosine(967)-C(5))-methyltransferase RsmB [Acidiferrobacterales bacterium]|nr:16S rRNA (cytosine(967)-C(5))-methyltransferase RsmB [Acidiferrobacterales bacterium]
MAKPNLQLVAAHTLRDVIDQGRSLDRTLESEAQRLGAEQRPSLHEIAYGGLRFYSYFDGLLAQLIAKPIRRKDRMVHFLLIVGLYQLKHMRTPDHAAVNQTVKALAASKQSWAKGLVNGVLRQFLREMEKDNLASLDAHLTAAQRIAFPTFFYGCIRDAWLEESEKIFESSNQKPPLTLRVNQQKTTRADYLKLLAAKNIDALPTEESKLGVLVTQPRPVTELPMFSEGWVSVQDESAQLCAPLLALEHGMRVLDGCAAPGGKTCAMLEAEPSLKMTAVDLPERVLGIEQNLNRLGLEAEIRDMGLEEYSDWWDKHPWDRILMDVPCSGSGVIRRHPDIRHRRQPGDLERFAGQQFDLLETAWGLLADNGLLLYVTCSLFPQENDGVIERFLSNHSDAKFLPVASAGGISTRYGRQRLPGVHAGDGFYYSLLSKAGAA